MSSQLTVFGALFLPLTVILALRRGAVLLTLIPVAAVMQSMAVATFMAGEAKFGLAATNVVFAAIGLRLLTTVVLRRQLYFGEGAARVVLILWVVFAAVSSVGAVLLPHIFTGLPVHLLLTNIDVTYPLEPLRWTISNFAQSINSIGCGLVLVFAVHESRDQQDDAASSLFVGFGIALGLTFILGLYHRLMLNGFVPDATAFLANNISYIQSFNSESWAPYTRASLPFIEPSYASAWFAAVFAGGLVGATWAGYGTSWSWVCAIGLAGLANSAGFSGIAAAVIFTLIFVAAYVIVLLRQLCVGGFQRKDVLSLLVVALCVGMMTYAAHLAQREVKWIEANVGIKLAELAMQGDTLGHRGKSNLTALSIATATYGLGAGAGSNRSSSYLFSLLSNTGVLGVILFLSALGLQCLLVVRNCFNQIGETRSLTGSYLGAFACLLVAVVGAIPDQNWPVLWAFITLGLLLALPPTNRTSLSECDTAMLEQALPDSSPTI